MAQTAASVASATCCHGTRRPTGSARGAGGRPRGRAPTARVGEEFPVACPGCGGDIRLIAFITDPGPIRRILTHVLLHTEWRTARTTARLSRPWPTDRLGRARAGPQRMRRDSDVAGRTARDRHPQPLTAFHATVRTAREQSGFKAGLRRRDKSGLERGQEAPRHLRDRAASSPIGSGCCSS
jgi:hypothetical protein